MAATDYPSCVPNWINTNQVLSCSGEDIAKLSPATGQEICRVTRSNKEDVTTAVNAAKLAMRDWSATPGVRRGEILRNVVIELQRQRETVAEIVSIETGKACREALGETDAAVAQGFFMAAEGQRLYGRTTTSAVANRYSITVRQPVGVAGLIIAANTPIANVAWKVFPALVCGNTAVLKAAEDAPLTAWLFADIAYQAGLPAGVLNVIQGLGAECGAALVENSDVGVISFTGSTAVGKRIAVTAGERLARVSLELGGKNPLVVCDDADLDNAVNWASLSAFSNAGQRCAAGSRIIIFDSVYEEFRDRMLARTRALKLGPTDKDDLGPVINERQLNNMLSSIETAIASGATLLCGGKRLDDAAHASGFYLQPTIIENAAEDSAISTEELFGPIACLYRVRDYAAALALANNSRYGLTACIHTANVHRATDFTHKVQAGVAVVNAGTYGSEPHMPFGGHKQSGNGSREPGTEALDVYTELKDIYVNIDPGKT